MENNFNYGNAANNDDELGDLLMSAELVIDQFDTTGNANYQDISDIIHEMGMSQAFDEVAVEGSHELEVWTRLNEIRDALAGAFHAAQRGAQPVQVIAPPVAANIYSPIQNVGRRTLPKGSENVVSRNNIRLNNAMVNFQGESGYGRYYKRNTFNSLPVNAQGRKQNPATRAYIGPQNVVGYTANVSANLNENLAKINTNLLAKANVSMGSTVRPSNTNNSNFVSNLTNGGKARRKTRKTKKSRKTRSHKK